MQGRGDPFFGFGDPFGSSGGPFGSFGGFRRRERSLISNFFGGRDPFDDPFFTRPFGSMFGSSFFSSSEGPFMNPHHSGFLEQEPSQSNRPRGPIIKELNSDNEEDESEDGQEKQGNLRKHRRSTQEPFIEDPEDENTEKKSRHMSQRNDNNQIHLTRSQPQSHTFTFQSSSVSYGGASGAYYTSSRTRRSGSDGLTFEECKEANSATRQATHRISRGLHDKGHSVTRELKSDGHVDTMQTLHNLNEDELTGFEEAWKGSARRNLPGWSEGLSIQDSMGPGGGGQHRPNRGGWALPPAERPTNGGNFQSDAVGMAGPAPYRQRMKTNHNDGTSSWRHRSKGSSSQAGKR
ncbi:uncharacterized protein LOC127255634 [Andrographis paniculata]|uniref:uncharacterized protein LOC127255634 n=1 Tax=Andrographis paniculata TaxID=175694 RepID=UPI0021E6F98E|nr:uncharacterized protein LOC127255634 [Andrographis paniculata]XP_051137233.1 uncharacterized protein LOC127255634 [Andrographis paniculata]XP_051137234.1 uncharacterized protein LOC127255634 [Andrographis paniculata]